MCHCVYRFGIQNKYGMTKKILTNVIKFGIYDGLVKSQKVGFSVIPAKAGIRTSYFKLFWTPAFAGVTIQETFYETIICNYKCMPKGGCMDKALVTVKGQVVIPSKLRRKLGIRKGTQVSLYERNGEIIIKPITDEYIRSMAGMTGTKGKLLKALREEKAKERAL